MLLLESVALRRLGTDESAIASADLRVVVGEPVCVVAPPGAGTSLLLAAIRGETPVASGRLTYKGVDVARFSRRAKAQFRREVAWIPQEPCLMPEQSALENVALAYDAHGVVRDAAALRDIMVRLALSHLANSPAALLTAAQQQRVAVARALVRPTTLVLADQPTSYQDQHGAALVLDALSAVATTSAVLMMARTLDASLPAGWRAHALQDGVVRDPNLDGDSIPIEISMPITAPTYATVRLMPVEA